MNQMDPGKLTSVDRHGDRIAIIPAEVRGYFRRHRTWTQMVLLVVFLGLPWFTINGHQTIHLNIPEREFALFGVLFRAHDTPLLFFILAFFTIGLAFVTSIWGRVWCGWACPQTVFIDGVFRRIELWIEGNHLKRRQLYAGPLNFERVTKMGSKWFLFTLVSALIAHSFLAYFVGAQSLLGMMAAPPSQNMTYFILVFGMTALILFNFAWFREQFCVIMCPYGRIQSVLLDKSSLAVVYDVERGEPRKGLNKNAPAGDCVACQRCVNVCPTGIDIRNGLQMECIACTACIDACDEIMEKVNKPKGLISYQTLDQKKINLLKPRSLFYLAFMLVMLIGFSYSIATRSAVHISVLRGHGAPYSFVDDVNGEKKLLNGFRIHAQNQSDHRILLKMDLQTLDQDVQVTVAENPVTLEPGQSREWFFFVRFPTSVLEKNGQKELTINITDPNAADSISLTREIILIGPKQ